MVNGGYVKYMRSPIWRLKCKQFWYTIGGMACQACGATKKLHVHHVTYERFTRELFEDLRGLCEPCHKEVHRLHRSKGGDLRFWTDRYILLERKKRGL